MSIPYGHTIPYGQKYVKPSNKRFIVPLRKDFQLLFGFLFCGKGVEIQLALSVNQAVYQYMAHANDVNTDSQ